MSTPTVAIVTASTGRAELQQTIDSVRAQSHPCTHYVFFDGVPPPDTLDLAGVQVCRLPVKTGANGIMNGGVVAASAYLVRENLIAWLDDDNWYEPNHIETLLAAKQAKPYSYSLRKLCNVDGSFFANDEFESVGHFGALVDLNCYLMDRGLAVSVAPLWYKTTGRLMVGDRYVFDALKKRGVDYACSGKYTVNYRLSATRDLRRFFAEGNARARAKYPDGLPWEKS